MKTKIVYCIVSSESDIYLEQAWVSIYTLKKYNPDAKVILLVDKDTESTLIGKRAGIKELVTELIAVAAPEGYNAMQRSRYLKTNFRQFIDGDLLFIDSDTVIGGSLADIDNIDAEIACVPDLNRKFEELIEVDVIKKRISSVFNVTKFDSEYYFNSGVIYVKDTPKTRSFFSDWYEHWKYSALERNISIDQPALYVADMKNGFIIKTMPGEYNCQITYSLKNFYGAIIIHFFTNSFPLMNSSISVFYGNNFYKKLQNYGGVVREVKETLDDKTMWFNLQTRIIDDFHFDFLSTPVGFNVYKSYKEGTLLYKLLDRWCVYKSSIHNYLRMLVISQFRTKK